jgi:hypothetical protein
MDQSGNLNGDLSGRESRKSLFGRLRREYRADPSEQTSAPCLVRELVKFRPARGTEFVERIEILDIKVDLVHGQIRTST